MNEYIYKPNLDLAGSQNNKSSIYSFLKLMNDTNQINKNEEYVMYVIVNQDLQMGKGKIASQSCHSVGKLIRQIESSKNKPEYYTEWLQNSEPIVVLKATQQQMFLFIRDYELNPISDLWCVHTKDAGRTQIDANSLTTIAFKPIKRKNTPEIIKSLKLM